MVTMHDVAKAAGVSPMTVSHVVNHHPHVADATRAKVLRAISELDYRVNIAARNLRRGSTRTIGLAVPEVDRPYYGLLASLIIEQAAARDLHVVIEQTGRSRDNELDALALSRNRMYDGLILATVGLGEDDRDLLNVDYPVVILGERIFQGPVDHVAMPNVNGAAAATRHLIARGARRIATIHGRMLDEVDVSHLRHMGYEQSVRAAGLSIDPRLTIEIDDFSLEGGRDAARELIARRVEFDALFCVTDYVAYGAMRGLHEAGLRVPDDVQVIGFDDVDYSAYSVPALSSVNPDHGLMARMAVEMLAARIDGIRTVHEEFVPEARVIARESTR